MKKISLYLFFLCLTCLSMVSHAQDKNSKAEENPLNYPFFIYGEQTVNGRASATLNNIKYKGFSSIIPEGGAVKGKKEINNDYGEKIFYEFKEISTYPELNLENQVLKYWLYSEGNWIQDNESGNATAKLRLDKDSYFVLVLDCSYSLGAEFINVQDAAKQFIDILYKVSDRGNIQIGVICFSSMENTSYFPIAPLTPTSKGEMIDFIDKQHNSRKATAMYYAINKGIDALVSCQKKINPDMFEGMHLITFTDGLDNTSQLDKEQKYTINAVRDHVKNRLATTEVKGIEIDSWVIAVRGEDVKEGQVEIMTKQLPDLASSADQFRFLTDISELVGTFSDIAGSLTKRWKNMICTSALNHDGPVCWTLGNVTPEPTPTPAPAPVVKPSSETKEMFLGVNLGVGGGTGGFNFTAGVDFAYPLTSKFGLGGYLSLGSFSSFGVDIGALATIGNHDESNYKYLCGVGGHFSGEATGVDLRFGVEFRNGLYLLADLYVGGGAYYSDFNHEEYTGASTGITINLGYDLGKLFFK
ncbi:MAG: VWA domain-containing protein [Bacteroidaceae bacterium]|nr:VWA domain-containing protein [Bacteroidaceae bacterium]